MGKDTKSPNIVTIRKYDNVVETKGDFPDVEKGEAIFTHVLPETLFPDSSGIVFEHAKSPAQKEMVANFLAKFS